MIKNHFLHFASRNHWPYPPKHKDIPFLMNMQTTVLLDPFTAKNGATAIRRGNILTKIRSAMSYKSIINVMIN